jgi:hypothetical protein
LEGQHGQDDEGGEHLMTKHRISDSECGYWQVDM